MRWTLIIVLAFASVAAAQPPQPRTPPPPGVDIAAKDGDRIIVDDDARIQIVRRRQATIRTIFSAKEQLLIVLVDYAKPGEFPDGIVDWAFNFYQVDGTWPLSQRWEALTAMYQYQGGAARPSGIAFETPRGLVQLLQSRPEVPNLEPSAFAVLSYRGSSNGPRRGVSFAEAETIQLHDFARSNESGATVSTMTAPDGRLGTAVVTGGIRRGDSPAPQTRPVAPPVAPPYPEAMRQANVSTPPPAGEEIPARDGDRVIVDDDARIQIVRRRQATIRTIFDQDQRLLIVLLDDAKAGELPDGRVDAAFNFYDVEGTWPLAPRWEAVTTMFRYESDQPMTRGYGLMTQQGLVHVLPARPEAVTPEPGAIAVVMFRGSMGGGGRGLSFAEAEKVQLAEAATRKSSPKR